MGGSHYEIWVDGHLDQEWTDLFEGVSATNEVGGITLITLPTADQATLHGILAPIRDLNLRLLAVTLVPGPEREK